MAFLFNFCAINSNESKPRTNTVAVEPLLETNDHDANTKNKSDAHVKNHEKNEIEKNYRKLDQEYKLLKLELDKTNSKCTQLNKEKDEWLLSVSGNDDKSQQLLQEIAKYKNNSEELDKKLLNLRRVLSEKEIKFDDLQKDIRELQEETDKTKRENDSLKELNDSLKEELNEVKDETEVLESQRDQYELWSNQKRDKIEILQQEYKQLKEEKNELQQKMKEEYNELQIKYSTQQENINRKNSDYEQLYTTFKQMETTNEELIKQYKKLKDEKNKLQQLYENMEIEKAKLLLKNKELMDDNNDNNDIDDDNNDSLFKRESRQHIATISKFKSGDVVKKDYGSTHLQQEILNNESLRKQSLSLLNDNNMGLIKFMKKMIASDVSVNKLWNKIDSNNSGKIGTKKLTKFLSLPVIFYQATQHQKNKEKNKGSTFKPNVDIQCVEHLSIWIMRCYGKKTEDGSYRIQITKIDFKTKLIGWMTEYIDCNGMNK